MFSDIQTPRWQGLCSHFWLCLFNLLVPPKIMPFVHCTHNMAFWPHGDAIHAMRTQCKVSNPGTVPQVTGFWGGEEENEPVDLNRAEEGRGSCW